MGKNLFVATEASGPPELEHADQEIASAASCRDCFEGSNVDVVREMTDMISAQRAFEMNSKVVQAVDQMLQHTVNVR